MANKWSTEKLEAQSRPQGTKGSNNKLRKEFRLPAVAYGPALKENIHCSIDYVAFEKLFAVNERHVPFTLAVDGKECQVVVKDYKIDPVSRRFMHIDFFAFKNGKEFETLIPIVFSGVPVGVREGGNLLTYVRKVLIRATPEKMPRSLNIDISGLQRKQYLIVRDLALPEGTVAVTSRGTVVTEVK